MRLVISKPVSIPQPRTSPKKSYASPFWVRAYDALFLVFLLLDFAGTLVPPLEFFGRSAAIRCFSVRAVQLPRCFSCGQGRAAPLLLFVRAVQLFSTFRGNRPAGGARWVDVTSPLWATDNQPYRYIQTPVFSESTVFARLDRIVSLSILSCRLSSNSCSAALICVFVLREEFAFLFQTFSRSDPPGKAPLTRGRYVFKKKEEKRKKLRKRSRLRRRLHCQLRTPSLLLPPVCLPGEASVEKFSYVLVIFT